MTPSCLRHPHATRQALVMGCLAAITGVLTVMGVVANAGWLRAAALVLAVPALFFAYMCVRTATLRVRLDEVGVWEPNPFRLTFVTPWGEISQIRTHVEKRRLHFVGVQLVYRDGEQRAITALTMQAGAAGAQDAVERWVEQIRAARAAAR